MKCPDCDSNDLRHLAKSRYVCNECGCDFVEELIDEDLDDYDEPDGFDEGDF